MVDIVNEFSPDFVSPPGDTLLEALEDRGMSQAELAIRMGRPPKTINGIIKGNQAITPETAIQLERVLGIRAVVWANLEGSYRAHLAKEEEKQELATHLEWLKEIPVAAMANLGWVERHKNKTDQLQEMLSYFGIATPLQWNGYVASLDIAFRKAKKEGDPAAVVAWLRKGELLSQGIECEPYDAGAFSENLQIVRGLTTNSAEVFQGQATELCRLSGVVLCFVPQLPKTRASGAARWLTPEKASIQLSLRYKTDDQLWFSFFHEAGHLLLHSKKKIFVDEDAKGFGLEREADAYAADTLIPPSEIASFASQAKPTKARIHRFASELGIAPGIVVGRLQHEGLLPFSHCNDLKRKLRWK